MDATQGQMLMKVASFVNAAGPELERLQNIDNQIKASAQAVAEKLAAAGLIAKERVADQAKELAAGGVAKFASVIDRLVSESTNKVTSMGKAASAKATADDRKESDKIWEARFGVNRSN